MKKVKVEWLGTSGYHPGIGLVKRRDILSLDEEIAKEKVSSGIAAFIHEPKIKKGTKKGGV